MMVLLQFLVHKTLTCWLPGTKVRPLLHDFSQAQVIPQRKKIEKADLWSDPAHLYLFIYFLNSAQVLCMLETKTLLLLCLPVILFSEDFFFFRGCTSYLTAFISCPGPFSISLAKSVYLESKIIQIIYCSVFIQLYLCVDSQSQKYPGNK